MSHKTTVYRCIYAQSAAAALKNEPGCILAAIFYIESEAHRYAESQISIFVLPLQVEFANWESLKVC